jgi:hypothetical protein
MLQKTEHAMHIFIFFCDPLQKCSKKYAPKRRFWKNEQEIGRVVSRYFATIRSPNQVFTHRGPGGTGSADRATPAFCVARCAGIAAALGLVHMLTLPSQIAKACVRLGSKKTSKPAWTDDSTDPLPVSMALPRLSTRRFGPHRPAQVWTDAAPLPPFGPGA